MTPPVKDLAYYGPGGTLGVDDADVPAGAAAGDLTGTYPAPTVTHARGLRETSGPTTLVLGAVADGQLLKRVGAAILSVPDAQSSQPPPVADLVALGALDTALLVTGTRRYVVSVGDTYALDTTSMAAPDGLTVIAANPAGNWIADLAGRWDDVLGDVSQGTANATLTYEAFRDTTFLQYFFRHDQDDSLSMRFQFPHGVSLDASAIVVPHLHVVPMSAPAAPENVRFTGSYAWAVHGAAIPAAVGWTAFGPILQPVAAGDAFKDMKVILADIVPPVGFKGSSILLVRVARTGTDPGDTYTTAKGDHTAAANLGLLSFDCHYRKATEGTIVQIPS